MGIEPSSNSIFKSNPYRKSTWKKMQQFCNTSWPKVKPFDALFLSGLGMYSTRLPCHSESANFFFLKVAKFYRNWSFSAIPGPIFCSQHILLIPHIPATSSLVFEIKVMTWNQDCPRRLVNTESGKYGSKCLSREEWVKNTQGLSTVCFHSW